MKEIITSRFNTRLRRVTKAHKGNSLYQGFRPHPTPLPPGEGTQLPSPCGGRAGDEGEIIASPQKNFLNQPSKYNDNMRRALLMYNPTAGRFPLRPFIGQITRTLAHSGWHTDVLATTSGAHVTESARRAADEKYDAVFVSGGDGTVGLAVSGLLGSETALGVLPSGTANVLALELGLRLFTWTRPRAHEFNARMLRDAPACAVDVGICNGQPFLLWAGMGLDALTVHTTEPRLRIDKFLAFPEYFANTIWNAAQWNGVTLKLYADEHEVEGHYMIAVANNIRRYMGGLAILSPDAHMDDGEFDLWLFAGATLSDALLHAYDLWRGNHITKESVQRIPFRKLRVEAATPFLVQNDGEPRPETKHVEISIRPRSLKLLVPQGALHLLAHAPAPSGYNQPT